MLTKLESNHYIVLHSHASIMVFFSLEMPASCLQPWFVSTIASSTNLGSRLQGGLVREQHPSPFCSSTPKCQTYDHGIGLIIDKLTLNLYLGKIQNYVSITSNKIFMNFVESLDFLLKCEVIDKKIHINYKMYPKALNFLQ
jgi:hypothetical protein